MVFESKDGARVSSAQRDDLHRRLRRVRTVANRSLFGEAWDDGAVPRLAVAALATAGPRRVDLGPTLTAVGNAAVDTLERMRRESRAVGTTVMVDSVACLVEAVPGPPRTIAAHYAYIHGGLLLRLARHAMRLPARPEVLVLLTLGSVARERVFVGVSWLASREASVCTALMTPAEARRLGLG